MIKYIPGDDNDADIFTKNTEVRVFEKHVPQYVGEKDEYLEKADGDHKILSQGECQKSNRTQKFVRFSEHDKKPEKNLFPEQIRKCERGVFVGDQQDQKV